MAHAPADASLAGDAGRQHGAFTRAQARQAGLSAHQIDRRLATGSWVRELPRVYRHALTPPTVLLRISAAVLWAGAGCALSHTTAGALWRLDGVRLDTPELVVPSARAPSRAGLTVHRAGDLGDDEICERHGLPLTSPVRTIVDLAAVLPDDELAAAVASARASGLVRASEIRARLDGRGTRGRAGTVRLRRLLSHGGTGIREKS